MTARRSNKEKIKEQRERQRETNKNIYNFADSLMTMRSVSLAMFKTHFPEHSLKFAFKLMTQSQRNVNGATFNGNFTLYVPTYRISERYWSMPMKRQAKFIVFFPARTLKVQMTSNVK
jgi:hypothetical protein